MVNARRFSSGWLSGVALSSLVLTVTLSSAIARSHSDHNFSGPTHPDPSHSGQPQQISMAPDADMTRLLSTLRQYDFKVSFSRPPHPKAYGLMQPSTKEIWVHPITYPLGIAKPTLIHEAVHAAQSCQSPSTEVIPIGIDQPISALAYRHFMRYHNYRRQVEAEALTVQGLPNGVDYAIQLLHSHC